MKKARGKGLAKKGVLPAAKPKSRGSRAAATDEGQAEGIGESERPTTARIREGGGNMGKRTRDFNLPLDHWTDFADSCASKTLRLMLAHQHFNKDDIKKEAGDFPALIEACIGSGKTGTTKWWNLLLDRIIGSFNLPTAAEKKHPPKEGPRHEGLALWAELRLEENFDRQEHILKSLRVLLELVKSSARLFVCARMSCQCCLNRLSESTDQGSELPLPNSPHRSATRKPGRT